MKKINWKNNQICINTIDTEPNNYHLGVGNLTKDWENVKMENSKIPTSLIVPEKTVRLNETDFNSICTVFNGSEIEKIYNFVNSKFKVGRVRLMKLNPKTCLSWHYDFSSRIHYVLKSSFGNKMVVEDECLHLQEHKWYLVDTTKYHTVFNGSMDSRIHLVFSIL